MIIDATCPLTSTSRCSLLDSFTFLSVSPHVAPVWTHLGEKSLWVGLVWVDSFGWTHLGEKWLTRGRMAS